MPKAHHHGFGFVYMLTALTTTAGCLKNNFAAVIFHLLLRSGYLRAIKITTKLPTMRVVIQRVQHASVKVNNETVAAIQRGLLVLWGTEAADTETDITWLGTKITQLRIFDDADGVMNLSVKDVDGEILLVSQFTLHASTKKGNRPSYIRAARPEISLPLFEQMCKQLESDLGKPVQRGVFGADMKVGLLNDGPVTIIIDTKDKE